MSTVEVWVGTRSCDCPGRSRTLPMSAELTSETHGSASSCHWTDSAGWEPCVSNEAEYEVLTSVAASVGLPVEPLAEWLARADAVAAEANEDDAAKWSRVFLRSLARNVATARSQVEQRQHALEQAANDLRVAQCRLVVAELSDLRLAELANRMLEAGWAGTSEELVAAATAVLRG